VTFAGANFTWDARAWRAWLATTPRHPPSSARAAARWPGKCPHGLVIPVIDRGKRRGLPRLRPSPLRIRDLIPGLEQHGWGWGDSPQGWSDLPHSYGGSGAIRPTPALASEIPPFGLSDWNVRFSAVNYVSQEFQVLLVGFGMGFALSVGQRTVPNGSRPRPRPAVTDQNEKD